jgi:S1-C subfamily serine protease
MSTVIPKVIVVKHLIVAALAAFVIVPAYRQAYAIPLNLNCEAPVVHVGDANPGRNPVTGVSVVFNDGYWHIAYSFADGSHVNREDQYYLQNTSSAKYPVTWGGYLRTNEKLYMNARIFIANTEGKYVYREILRKDNDVIVDMSALCDPAPVVDPAPPVVASAPPTYSQSPPLPAPISPPPASPSTFGGIGASLKMVSGYAEITSLISQAPAAKAGLQVGDQITGIDNMSVYDYALDMVIAWLRGPAGTAVNVRVSRASTTYNFRITRELISVSPDTPPTVATPSPAPTVTEEPTAPPKPRHESSSGTGFFVSTNGTVITNAHVVEDCVAIRVRTSQGATAAAKVLARDVRNDLALLDTGLVVSGVAAFRTNVRLGEAVEAFGYPLTDVLSKSGNFTLGNVSAMVGIGEDSRYFQISAPVQPGNSGGPLLDQNGNLVGVVSAKLNALKLMLATNGDIPQNVNFAIKSSIVTNFLDTNSASYAQGASTQPMQPAELADQAKAMSIFIECE